MSGPERGQVIASAAQVYDAFFVPALFGQWTGAVLDAAEVGEGHAVLDVGCGTGVLARDAARRVGPTGRVAGLDPNEGMLAVARAAPSIEWERGVAEDLPFPDHAFDRVVSQFALMFCTDAAAAFAEAARVTRPGGSVAFAVWDHLDGNVGYARLAALLGELFGADAADALRAPFRLGDPEALVELAAGSLSEPRVTSHRGTARFESLEAWLHTEIRGWTLADRIDDDDFTRLLEAGRATLGDLVGPEGVAFDVSALIVRGTPRTSPSAPRRPAGRRDGAPGR